MSKSRDTAAELAGEIVNTFNQRGNVYGDPEDNFGNIAAFWNAWLHARYPIAARDLALDATDVAHMSALIKKARLANTPTHRDSALDDAVYTLLSAGLDPAAKSQTIKPSLEFKNVAAARAPDGWPTPTPREPYKRPVEPRTGYAKATE